MILSHTEHIEKINAYNSQHWQPLFDLLPEMSSSASRSGVEDAIKNDYGIEFWPVYHPVPLEKLFHDTVSKLGILVSYDWAAWEEGSMMTSTENFDFDSVDVPTKCKLISAIVRNDRFCEGALMQTFESGLMQKIIQSIQRQVRAMDVS